MFLRVSTQVAAEQRPVFLAERVQDAPLPATQRDFRSEPPTEFWLVKERAGQEPMASRQLKAAPESNPPVPRDFLLHIARWLIPSPCHG